MVADLDRLLFTVTRHELGWAVEHGGEFFDLTLDRDEALASASRRARASNGKGLPSQVCIQGEPDFSRRRDAYPSRETKSAQDRLAAPPTPVAV